MTTYGPFGFATATTDGSDDFLYTDPVATDATLPQAANTARRWCWDNNDTTSTDVGPTSGQEGSPEGYLYMEMSSPGAFNDVFTLEFDTTLNASLEQFQFNFYTNQRGNDNNAVCQVQINESGGGWTDVGALFGGSGDSDKVATGGTQIWSSRSVDLSNAGANNDASTRVRIEITMPASGTTWHNDYGIDTIEIVGAPVLNREQDSYRHEDDDGSESGSTFREAQNTATTIARETNFRIRVGMQAAGDPAAEAATLQIKESADPASEWRTV